MKVKTCLVKIQAAGEQDGTEDGVFEAIVATYDLDSVGDRILPGAFADTLAAWKASGNPIPVLWSHMSHDPDYHIGLVEDAEERPEGLWVKARLDLDEPKSAKIYRLLKGRRVTQFSFAYEVVEGAYVEQKNEDGRDSSFYELRKLALYEVGPCLIGANQNTELLDIKARPPVPGPEPSEGTKAGRSLSADNEQRVRDIARLAKELLDSLASTDDTSKATPAPPATPTVPTPAAAPSPARPGPASTRLHTDLAALMAEAEQLTN